MVVLVVVLLVLLLLLLLFCNVSKQYLFPSGQIYLFVYSACPSAVAYAFASVYASAFVFPCDIVSVSASTSVVDCSSASVVVVVF